MKKTIFTRLGSLRQPMLIIRLLVGGWLIFYLTGCTCYSYCWLHKQSVKGSVRGLTGFDCDCACQASGRDCGETYGEDGKPVLAPDNPTPEKKEPGQAESSTNLKKKDKILPGEYFATTITAGPTLTFMNSGGEAGNNFQSQPGVGFQAGINNGFPLSKDWGITSGIRFKQMNASEKVDYGGGGSGGSTGFETFYRYNYVSGNLLAKYRINRHLSITAGPELNFLAGATRKVTNGDKENIKKDAKGFGADIIAGLKYEIPVPNQRSRWGISLLYDRRLSAVSKADVNQHLNASKLSSVQLGVSYFICGCNKKVSEK